MYQSDEMRILQSKQEREEIEAIANIDINDQSFDELVAKAGGYKKALEYKEWARSALSNEQSELQKVVSNFKTTFSKFFAFDETTSGVLINDNATATAGVVKKAKTRAATEDERKRLYAEFDRIEAEKELSDFDRFMMSTSTTEKSTEQECTSPSSTTKNTIITTSSINEEEGVFKELTDEELAELSPLERDKYLNLFHHHKYLQKLKQ
jgi:hypothetical protein